ncbi:MAG: hypothetical protein P8X96_20550 [Desulfobacteraceae bacterium]
MQYIPVLLVFICQEAVGLVIFPVMNRYLGAQGKKGLNLSLILKGVLERLVLLTALIHGYPQMLIAFAAMKLGTRLHEEQNTEISNTYFLAGNLISILLAMIGSIIVKAIWTA